MKIRVTNISGSTILIKLEPLGDFTYLPDKERLLVDITQKNEDGTISLIIDHNSIILVENNDIYIDFLDKK